MDHLVELQGPEEETMRPRPFTFAGVQLGAGEDSRDLVEKVVRARVRRELWFNLTGSVLAGTLPVLVERSLVAIGFIQDSPYSYLSRGLPLFYVGWAMYWGIRDAAVALALDEDHPLHGLIDVVKLDNGLPGVAFIQIVVIVYNLLGGGIYGFYKLVRQSRLDLAEVEQRKPVTTS